MAGKAIFIDTNILVYANIAESALHSKALESLETIQSSYENHWISRQILREYISAVTKVDPAMKPLSSVTIIKRIQYFEEIFNIAEDSSSVTKNLLAILEKIIIRGRKIHDANIVATMLSHNIPTLITENKKDFERFSSFIEVLTIEDIL
jgi:predicted nucleic acid-binding protein